MGAPLWHQLLPFFLLLHLFNIMNWIIEKLETQCVYGYIINPGDSFEGQSDEVVDIDNVACKKL